MNKKLSLSLCCYGLNEEELLETFFRKSIEDLKKVTDDYEIVFVDDGSYDRTWEIASRLAKEFPQIKIYKNDRNYGVGYSAMKTYKLAQKEIIFCNTVDMFFDTAELNKFLRYFDEDYDMVIGVRLERKNCYSIYRQLISWTNYYLAKWLFGIPFKDVQNVHFFPREFLQKVDMISRSSFISPELLTKAYTSGLKIKEVPMSFQKRSQGKAKGAKLIYLYQSIRDLFKFFIYWHIKGGKKRYRSIELGFLPDREKNRYWQIKLGKNKNAIFELVKKFIGIVVFAILLIPLSIITLFISSSSKGKAKKEGRNKWIEDALVTYREFMGVYPARVYSPVMKSLEVGLLKSCDFKPPILEIAVGDGYLSFLVFKGRKQKLDIGGDMIYETILSAKKYNHIDKLVVFDTEEIPFPDNCFNTVIMNNLMHHLPSRKKTLAEIERILRPGGQFLFTDNLSGWIEYTFDSRFLRFLRLGFIARHLENFKLNLFAQKLLNTSQYWDEVVKNSQMEVIINKDFVSKKAMTISSVFEYFNLLQGQPTSESMRTLLRIKPIKKFFDKRLEGIIRYLILNENELIKKGSGAFLFVVLRKKKSNIQPSDLRFACPRCKNKLITKDDKLICQKCGQNYAIRGNIAILLPYQKELKDFDKYLEASDKKRAKEYIT